MPNRTPLRGRRLRGAAASRTGRRLRVAVLGLVATDRAHDAGDEGDAPDPLEQHPDLRLFFLPVWIVSSFATVARGTPLIARYVFGPMNVSRNATDSRFTRRTDSSIGSVATQRRADRRRPRRGKGCPWTRSRRSTAGTSTGLPHVTTWLMQRHPSESMSPARNSFVHSSTISCCQGSRTIQRSCLRPGPCWGNRHGQCLE